MSAGKTVAIIFAICAGVGVLMLGICSGIFYLSYKKADATASPRVDALFSAIANHRFADTYETETTRELREAQSKEQYAALGEKFAEELGELKFKSLTGFKVSRHNGDSVNEATYRATFEKGEGTISVRLKQEDGKWKFLAFHVSSPVLKKESPDNARANGSHAHNAGKFTHRWPDGGSAGRQWHPGKESSAYGFDTRDDKYEVSYADPDGKTTTTVQYDWHFMDHKDGKDIYTVTRHVSVTERNGGKTTSQPERTITVEYSCEPITLFDDELGEATLAPVE